MVLTSIADHASVVTDVTTSGANARVQGGETDLPKVPLTGGAKKSNKRHTKKGKGSRKSASKKRRTRSRRSYKK
jgi:hypothetical protein